MNGKGGRDTYVAEVSAQAMRCDARRCDIWHGIFLDDDIDFTVTYYTDLSDVFPANYQK